MQQLARAEEHPTLDHDNIISSLFLTSSQDVVTPKTLTSSTKLHSSFLGEISAHQISRNYFFSVFRLIDISPPTWPP
jgi:hypothetical protein